MPATSPFVTSSHQPTGAVAGSAFVPAEDAELRGNHAPQLSPRPAFYYLAHPERWQVIEGKVLPLLGSMKIRAGVGGAVAGRTPGSVNLRAAKVDAEQKRRTIIPITSIPDAHATPGVPKSYLKKVEGCPNVTLSLYEDAFPGSRETRPDTKRFVEFLEYQIESGVIAPAGIHILERMLDHRQKALERVLAKDGKNVAKKERLEHEIEVIGAEIKARVKTAKPVKGAPVDPSALEE